MYQITNGTFAEARRYCIRRHSVVEDGPWNDWKSCWFNSLYTRVIPSHAVELTSAYLDRSVTSALERRQPKFATLERKQELAALIHLCGRRRRRGVRPARHALGGGSAMRRSRGRGTISLAWLPRGAFSGLCEQRALNQRESDHERILERE